MVLFLNDQGLFAFKHTGWITLLIFKERDSGRSRGFAFVRFFDKHDAEVRIWPVRREK